MQVGRDLSVELVRTCEAAQALVDKLQPQRALALINEVQSTPGNDNACDNQWTAASAAAAKGVAEVAAGNAVQADALTLEQAAKGDEALAAWERVKTHAITALAADEQAAGATALKDAAETRIKALGPASGQDDTFSPDALADSQSAWNKLVDDVLQPLGNLAGAIVATIAVLFLLARLVVLTPWANKQATSTFVRKVLWAGGLAATLACAWLLTITAPGAFSGGTTPWWAFLIPGCGVVAAVLLGVALATRLRLHVDAKDTDTATRLVTHLRQLGAEPARGVEVPLGTDVDILNGTAIAKDISGWLAPLAKAVSGVLGVTPWRATVTSNDSGTYILVTRNGRGKGSTFIPAKSSDGIDLDGEKMAAAFILTTLAKAYFERDFVELAGATDGLSLGLQYLADAETDEDIKTKLLTRAVDVQPGNLLAQVALSHHLERRTTDSERLVRYKATLDEFATRFSELKLHRMEARIRYTTLAIEMNLAAVRPAASATYPRRRVLVYANGRANLEVGARRAARDLAETMTRLDTSDRLACSLRIAATPLFEWLDRPLGPDDRKLMPLQLKEPNRWRKLTQRTPSLEPVAAAQSTLADFNRACALARPVAAPGQPPGYHPNTSPDEETQLWASLQRALEAPGRRAQAQGDPFIEYLLKGSEFRSKLPVTARSDILTIAPFEKHADVLTRYGLTSAQQISQTGSRGRDIAALPEFTAYQAWQLAAAARLVLALPLPDLSTEIAAALFSQNLATVKALRAIKTQHETTLATVTRALIDQGLPDMNDDDSDRLSTWLADPN